MCSLQSMGEGAGVLPAQHDALLDAHGCCLDTRPPPCYATLRCLRSEEWARRIAALRGMLQERDAEVAQLQHLLGKQRRALEGQGDALGKREAEVARQAQRIAQLERRIDRLMRQLSELQGVAPPMGATHGESSFWNQEGHG